MHREPPADQSDNLAAWAGLMVWRSPIYTKRMPGDAVPDVTVQPIMFVPLFAFVFGAAIDALARRTGVLLPGIMGRR